MQKPKFYSLPKTQPTRSSSEQRLRPSDSSFYQLLTTPDVSEFNLNDNETWYTHTMKIDYGRIQEPESVKKMPKTDTKAKHVKLSAFLEQNNT